VLCWAGINLDISRHKAGEEALEESLRSLRVREHELQSIADNTPDLLSRFDRQHRHVFANAAVERLLEHSREYLLDKTNRELDLPEALCSQWEEALERVFQTGNNQTIEFTYGVPPRYFRARMVPEPDPSGQLTHVLVVSQDITGMREAEEALREADRRKD